MDKRTWTDLWTTRLKFGSEYKAIIIFFIACQYVLFISPLYQNNVIYSFRWCKYSFLFIIIDHNFLSHPVFYFNTPLYMYLNALSYVKFYLSRVYNIFGLPVCIKVFYTQLGIDICLIKYYTETYWLINIYLPIVTVLWSRDIYSPKELVIPRNRWLRLNMTEKLFTGTLNHNQNKQNKTKFCGL